MGFEKSTPNPYRKDEFYDDAYWRVIEFALDLAKEKDPETPDGGDVTVKLFAYVNREESEFNMGPIGSQNRTLLASDCGGKAGFTLEKVYEAVKANDVAKNMFFADAEDVIEEE